MSYLFTPGLDENTLSPRPYQTDALEAVRSEFKRGIRRTMVVHPTGVGKGILIALLNRYAAEKGNRTLSLAHLGELIDQIANSIERAGVMPAIEKAGAYARAAFHPMSVVASVASMRGARLESWPRDFFDLVIVDEAHHSVCPTFTDILDHFPKARVVGLTATPDRADDEKVDTVFQSIAHEMTIAQAVYAPPPGPYLVRPIFVQEDVGADLRDLNAGRRDYNEKDLAERIIPVAADIGNKIRERVGERPTIVFTPNVASATAFASALCNIYRDDRADWVSGDDPFRDHKIRRYKSGGSQFLVCCHLLTEGFDAPRTSAIALCRPTRSYPLMRQMVGRGLRTHHGKTDALILDFAWLTDEHDATLKRPAGLFTRELAEFGAEDEASKRAASGQPFDILSFIEAARKGGPKKVQRPTIEVRARERDVPSIRSNTIDPFAGCPLPPRRLAFSADFADRPTDRMIGFLKARGHADAANFTRSRAGKMIGLYKAAEKAAEAQREAS